MLGRAGHRVVVFERFEEIYRLPRAVHLDHEIMRLLQSLGLSDVLAEEMVPVHEYEWFGADGEPLLRFDVSGLARSGWESDYMFFQPELEAAIHRYACVPSGVAVERGWVAEGLEDLGDHVELTLHRVSEEATGQLAKTGSTGQFAPGGWSGRMARTRSCARRALSAAATLASRSGGWSWTPSRMTWARLPTSRSRASGVIRRARPRSSRAAPPPALGVHAAPARAAVRFRGSRPRVVAA